MKNVEIYTGNDCHYCHEAKEFFEEKNVPFTEQMFPKTRKPANF
jgi:glutaredoxin 3